MRIWLSEKDVYEVPRQLTLDLSLAKILRLRKPLGPLNPNTAGKVQGEQCRAPGPLLDQGHGRAR